MNYVLNSLLLELIIQLLVNLYSDIILVCNQFFDEQLSDLSYF